MYKSEWKFQTKILGEFCLYVWSLLLYQAKHSLKVVQTLSCQKFYDHLQPGLFPLEPVQHQCEVGASPLVWEVKEYPPVNIFNLGVFL